MDCKAIIKFLIIPFSGINLGLISPVHSSTILNCNGAMPKKTICLIKATTYKVDISRIDICKKNPFPSFLITPNLDVSNCISLYNIENTSKKVNLDINSKFDIPSFKNPETMGGQYSYLSMILKNNFTISGKYTVGNLTYKTGSKGPKDILEDKNPNSKPLKFSEKLTSWRGKQNKDNKYCNQGGTKSRCDLVYNGFKINTIGLNSDLFESNGKQTKYVFYAMELAKPVNITNTSNGYFDIKYIKNLEVYGDGRKIRSISMAPFLFKTLYKAN